MNLMQFNFGTGTHAAALALFRAMVKAVRQGQRIGPGKRTLLKVHRDIVKNPRTYPFGSVPGGTRRSRERRAIVEGLA